MNWLKMPGPFGFPRYGWIAGVGAFLVAGYIFFRNRKPAQTPTVNPADALSGGGMMPTTYPYPSDSGDGAYPPYPPIPPSFYPGGDPHGVADVAPNSRQVPGGGTGTLWSPGPLGMRLVSGNAPIYTPTQLITQGSVLSNGAIMPLSVQRQASLQRSYSYAPPPGAIGTPVTPLPPTQISPTSVQRQVSLMRR